VERIQASIVRPLPAPTSMDVEAGTRTKLPLPSKLKACPSSPVPNEGFVKMPLLVP
jgi:hypothetical protein